MVHRPQPLLSELSSLWWTTPAWQLASHLLDSSTPPCVTQINRYLNPRHSHFLHQIYSASFASAFHDVTNGTNPGCGTAGFSTAKGWDPVTGLGTPNFPKLVSKWLALPWLGFTNGLLNLSCTNSRNNFWTTIWLLTVFTHCSLPVPFFLSCCWIMISFTACKRAFKID